MASKKQGTSALAASPIDFVLVTGSVRVQQDLISGFKFTLIDFRGQLRICQGWRRQLIKPSELCVGLILKIIRTYEKVWTCPEFFNQLLFSVGMQQE